MNNKSHFKQCNCNIKGFIKASILLMLSKSECHGYTLQKNIIESGLIDSVDIASIYRHLTALEKKNFISFSWEESTIGPDKKVYAITAKGKDLLKNFVKALSDKKERLNMFLDLASKYD